MAEFDDPPRGQVSMPVDSDVDLHDRQHRRELRRHGRQVLAVIAIGGMAGAAGRYGVEVGVSTATGNFPWETVTVNVTGSFLIGVLMVFIIDAGPAYRLVRPFLGVGVLGGYTTFSTYTVETQTLIASGHPGLAFGYLFGTAAMALVAVTLGVAATRALVVPRARKRGGAR